MAPGARLDALLEQVDQGSQVVAVEPIQISEDIAVPRRESDLTAWVRAPPAALQGSPWSLHCLASLFDLSPPVAFHERSPGTAHSII